MSTLLEAYHNGLRERLAAAIAALATVLGIVSVALPTVGSFLSWPIWLGMGVALVLGAFALSIPRGSQIYLYEQGGWSIELIRGNLLSYSYGCVITSDRIASTRLNEVGASSLVGQVVSHWYGGDDERLTNEIDRAIAEMALNPPLPLGQTIPFGLGTGHSGWLFCLAERTPSGSRTNWRDLATAYTRLWEQLRAENVPELNCPIIGAGYAGSSLSARGTLTFLLLGFHGSSIERRVTRRLRIVVSEADFDPRMY